MSAQDEQELREALRRAVVGRICNVSNLPDWMQTPALGRNMGPLAESVVDALLPVVLADREKAVQQARAEVVERVEAVIAGWDCGPYCGDPAIDYAHACSGEAIRAALREAQP